jgi:hypothetical protein
MKGKCPPGYTKKGNSCTKTEKVSIGGKKTTVHSKVRKGALKSRKCPKDFTREGNLCKKVMKIKGNCINGFVKKGSTCVKETKTPAGKCPKEYKLIANVCTKTTVFLEKCPPGYKKKNFKCVKEMKMAGRCRFISVVIVAIGVNSQGNAAVELKYNALKS